MIREQFEEIVGKRLDRFIAWMDATSNAHLPRIYAILFTTIGITVTWLLVVGAFIYVFMTIPDIRDVPFSQLTLGMVGRAFGAPIALMAVLWSWVESDLCWSKEGYKDLGKLYSWLAGCGFVAGRYLGLY